MSGSKSKTRIDESEVVKTQYNDSQACSCVFGKFMNSNIQIAEVAMAQAIDDSGPNEPFLEHMTEWIELIMSFNAKMHSMELGPADGKLYMQACDLLTAHAQRLERMLNEDCKPNTTGKPPDDAQSKSDRPADPTA